MFTPTRMPYQHNRTGSRALCFEMKSDKSLKTSKIYKISKTLKYPNADWICRRYKAVMGFVLRWNQNKSLKIAKIFKTPKYPKLQNIQNSKIYNEYKVQERWLDLQALQGSEAPRSLQPAVASKIKQSWTKQSKVELNKAKQSKAKPSKARKNKARPASVQLASWVWCSGDDQRLNAIYERESSTDDLDFVKLVKAVVVKARQRVVVLWDDPHHHDS